MSCVGAVICGGWSEVCLEGLCESSGAPATGSTPGNITAISLRATRRTMPTTERTSTEACKPAKANAVMSPRVKKLSTENWLTPEDIMEAFVRLTPSGEFQSMSGDDWVAAIARPTLVEPVPEDVRVLFEVARGALVYGFFFYPLYALGMEQVFRVTEAAVTHKCEGMGAPKSAHSYERKIQWLIEQGVIPKAKEDVWHAVRKLRNMASHPAQQTFVPPGVAITALARAAEEIKSLYQPARQ